MIGGRRNAAPTLELWHFPGPVRTPAPTEKLPYLGRGRCLIGPPSIAGQQHSINQADREEAKRSFAERSLLSFLSRKRAVSKGTRRRSGGILLLRGCYFPNDGKVTKGSPGFVSEECKHSSRQPPDPVTGDASRGVVPRIRRGQGRGLPSFPRRCRWRGGLEKARQAGPGKRAWYKQP